EAARPLARAGTPAARAHRPVRRRRARRSCGHALPAGGRGGRAALPLVSGARGRREGPRLVPRLAGRRRARARRARARGPDPPRVPDRDPVRRADRMNFELTSEQQEVRALARDFAEREVAPVIRRFDEAHEFPHEILAKLAGSGLLGALVPEEYGGAGLDYVSYALAVEELNRVDASVGITMWAHNSLCTNHITLFGSKEQKAAYLPRLARGESLGAWGLSGPGSCSDAPAMKTRAVADGERFVLNGSKAFITNAGVAEVAVVM